MYAQFANESDPWGRYQPPAGGGAVQQMHGPQAAVWQGQHGIIGQYPPSVSSTDGVSSMMNQQLALQHWQEQNYQDQLRYEGANGWHQVHRPEATLRLPPRNRTRDLEQQRAWWQTAGAND